ncbi:MAG: TetR/AcrR family transcriptional regulator [Bacillota bacterium]|nr:TetR/AcrR family transcriptional regulator [Bacillota bacterium]
MNKVTISKNEIIQSAKTMAMRIPIQEISIREIAKQCGMSVGSVYNCFPSKNELLIETVTAIWDEIVDDELFQSEPHGFLQTVESLFHSVKAGEQKYPSFLNRHGLVVSNKEKGKELMLGYLETIKEGLLKSLRLDRDVKADFFATACSESEFVDFVFLSLVNSVVQKQPTCKVLLAMIQASIYE